jgi:hypothetical protein
MNGLDRRSVWTGLAAAAITEPGRAETGSVRLSVRPREILNRVPADYVGFSAETAQLGDPSFYHPDNKSLIALHRRLTPNGVLRLGGNSSEFCWWKPTPDTMPPAVKALGLGRTDNWMPQQFTAIAPEAVRNLRGFLDACGWRCIWGLNFGTGSPERDAAEAAAVAAILGPKLLYFQIGNEPDFYREANNLLRPKGWDFPDYLNEWTAIAESVAARVPDARFGGPDVGAASDWVVRFAREAPKRIGKRLVALSGHYYASGPPDAPSVTVANLLGRNDAAARRMAEILPAARAAGLTYRMTEGNSCYRGGKPGMSNAFAAALWGADYMLDMAAHGAGGINFHGGPGRTIAHSLGGKLPGARSDADRDYARLGSFYSPFAGSRETGFSARPLFYGMMLAERFAGGAMTAVDFAPGAVNAAAYAARTAKGFRIAVLNKDATRDLKVALDIAGKVPARVRLWRLSAPALDAVRGVRFAGSEVAPGTALWRPQTETVAGGAVVGVPRASAALIFAE